MTDPAHIPLVHRKVICGRLRVFTALLPSRRAVNLHGIGGAYSSLQKNLTERISAEAKKSAESDRLDAFVKGLLPWFEAQIQAVAGVIPEPFLADIKSSLSSHFEAVDCAACTQGGKVCSGPTIVDNPIVAAGGKCLEPFKDQFEFIRKTVLQKYQTSCDCGSLLTGTNVYLSTRILEAPAAFRVAKHARAATFYRDGPQGRASCIELQINPAKLDHGSFAVVPYLLFHELVCHAWQGLDTRSNEFRQNVDETSSNDSFAEGWMDVVAWRLFAHTVRRMKPNSALFHQEHEMLSHELHRERRDYLNADPDLADDLDEVISTRTMVSVGAEAAYRLLNFLRERQVELDEDPESLWLKISFALNLRAGIAAKRQELVTTLHDALSPRDDELSTRDKNALQGVNESVRNYSKNGDLGGFMQQILGISADRRSR